MGLLHPDPTNPGERLGDAVRWLDEGRIVAFRERGGGERGGEVGGEGPVGRSSVTM